MMISTDATGSQVLDSARLWRAALLILLVLIALAVRVFHLDEVPQGLYPDEAVNALDAYRALTSGE